MSLRSILDSVFGSAWHVNHANIMSSMLPAVDGTAENSKFVTTDASGNVTVPGVVGGGGQAAPAGIGIGGNINRQIGTIGSSATNTTQTLATYSLPPNTLKSVNNGILVQAWGRKAGNAAPVTLALNVGGTTINTGSFTSSGSHWFLDALIYKTAANAQQELYTGQLGATLVTPKSTNDTSVDTGTITITVQALDASAGQSNVLLDGLVTEYFQ
jgi:hypothetical protein